MVEPPLVVIEPLLGPDVCHEPPPGPLPARPPDGSWTPPAWAPTAAGGRATGAPPRAPAGAPTFGRAPTGGATFGRAPPGATFGRAPPGATLGRAAGGAILGRGAAGMPR